VKTGSKNILTRQIIQNSVVFAGFLFAHRWNDLLSLCLAFVAFIILGIFSYIIIETVRIIEKERGEWTYIFLTMQGKLPNSYKFIFLSMLLISYVRPAFGLTISAYILIAFSHELFFIRQVIMDVVSLAVGFSLRAIAGVVILDNVTLSPWLVACTFLLSMVVSLGKRRNDILRKKSLGRELAVNDYTERLLDQMIAVVTSSTFITYILYTISHRTTGTHGSTNLIYTIPFVLYGILRYLYLINKKDLSSGSEIAILKDSPMLINIMLWLSCIIAILNIMHV